jgi:hypothetical protein
VDHNLTYIAIVFALSGTLQLSHVHIATDMNIVMHESDVTPENSIVAGTAYSITPLVLAQKVVIGDPLPLRLSVRWFKGTSLRKISTSSSGGSAFKDVLVLGLIVGVVYVLYLIYKKRTGAAYKSYPGSGPYGYGFPHGYGLPVAQGGSGTFNYHGGATGVVDEFGPPNGAGPGTGKRD